jgi:hypothetical protein
MHPTLLQAAVTGLSGGSLRGFVEQRSSRRKASTLLEKAMPGR